ncbi:MAG: hypothetical protein AB7T06_09115 [Kofleriaceae bacterium]
MARHLNAVVLGASLALLIPFANCTPRMDVDESYATGSGSGGSDDGDDCPFPCLEDDPGDDDECRGECGAGCDGIDGNHFCTEECMAHDDCYRGCLDSGCPTCYPVVCMAACTLEWYEAYKSVFECAYGLRDCTCE